MQNIFAQRAGFGANPNLQQMQNGGGPMLAHGNVQQMQNGVQGMQQGLAANPMQQRATQAMNVAGGMPQSGFAQSPMAQQFLRSRMMGAPMMA